MAKLGDMGKALTPRPPFPSWGTGALLRERGRRTVGELMLLKSFSLQGQGRVAAELERLEAERRSLSRERRSERGKLGYTGSAKRPGDK